MDPYFVLYGRYWSYSSIPCDVVLELYHASDLSFDNHNLGAGVVPYFPLYFPVKVIHEFR
jgi:hypothetical protein